MYPRCHAAIYNTPLAILPEKLTEIRTFIDRKAAEPWTKKDRKLAKAAVEPVAGVRDRAGVEMVGRVALLPLFGVISQRMNMLTYFSGGTSSEEFGAALDSLVADKQVKAVVLVVDSPGGSVFGVGELAAKVLAARDKKRIVAIADSMAASAAYWIASQASEFNVTPGGQVGSIGVIAAHVDESKAEEEAGLKTTLVTAGKYKAELDPSQPLSPEAKDNLQQAVDDYYAMFVSSVAKGRGVTEGTVKGPAFGQGRMKLAADAKASGMVDRVATLAQVLKRLGEDTSVTSAETIAPSIAARRAQAAARARAVQVETDG